MNIEQYLSMNELLLILIVALPFVGSFILPALGRISEKIRNITAFSLVFASLALSVALIPFVYNSIPEQDSVIRVMFQTGIGSNWLYADGLAIFMAIVSSLVGAIIVLYSFGYISHYENRNEYYFMVVLFLGSMMGLVFSRNLLLTFVFWEITAIASWRLIGFFREKDIVVKADKAFLVTVFGALLMLIGFFMIYQQTGSFDLSVIKEKLGTTPISDTAVLLIILGIFAKSATLPLHTWLPDAGVAPSPVTALLHAAVLVKIGVYIYARFFVEAMPISQMWHVVVPAVAGLSALVAAGAALIDTDLKRIIAYSTVSQIGFIFLGLSIGNEIGIAGGLLYILMHGISKGGLFLCAGIVEQKTHTKDITKLGGLMKTMPVTAISFLLCAFSVMGIPPFGGFFSKFMVIWGGVQSGQFWMTLVYVFGAVLTIIYLFRAFTMVFLGEEKTHAEPEGSPIMVYSVASLAALSLLSGLFVMYPSEFVSNFLGVILR